MRLEEDQEHFIERNHGGVERNLANFGVSCLASADRFVGRVSNGTASIAGDDGLNTIDALVDSFDAPKATAPECRCFLFFFFGSDG